MSMSPKRRGKTKTKALSGRKKNPYCVTKKNKTELVIGLDI